MYEAFFGLKEKPFRMTPDTRYFYPSAKHTNALNHMVYAIEERRGFVVITGEIGSGKTTLSRVLFQKLDASTQTAIIRNTQLSAKDLVASTLDELEIPYRPSNSKAFLIGRLNEYLIEQLRDGNNVVLLIDEAQNLKPSVLEEVRMLSNLETETEKLIQIILMGQPELKSKLWLKELTQLRQRVTLHYHLCALDSEETMKYVTHRLHVAGANGSAIFSSSALPKVYEHSQGVPRLINGLCDRALLTGYVNESKIIGPEIIDEVACELPALMQAPNHPHVTSDK
ncbi:MAG: AAA family ATPase [Candidatus Omnitrophica bacterium]|nr:AAA family ATPase [Candidatus Omnitrophota bacterium]